MCSRFFNLLYSRFFAFPEEALLKPNISAPVIGILSCQGLLKGHVGNVSFGQGRAIDLNTRFIEKELLYIEVAKFCMQHRLHIGGASMLSRAMCLHMSLGHCVRLAKV